jgi:hypothetical protein
MLRFPCIHHASVWGAPVFVGGIRVRATPSCGLTAGELALFVSCVVVLSILSTSCCCWRSATSRGLALFCHRSASRIFIMQPGCILPPVVIYKDDHQPRGGEKRARLRPPPCPQLQGCSSSSLGWKASRVGILPSAWLGDPLLPSAFGGEGRSPALRRRQTSATRGRPAASAVSCRVSGSLAWMASVPPPTLPPAAWSGRGCSSTTRATVAPCAGLPHPWRSLRNRLHCFDVVRGVVQDVVRCGGGGRVLGWSCPHSRRRTGVRTSSHALRWPSSLVSHRCRGGRCRRC